ncbi:hypothetical protein M1P56_19500 [Streptomyces sp. HU2014]|uniref:Uncharacterized protein n=1 Tax=Streptomyces albireticuli TaxID=1940 RepID=A0A1Z2KVZ3_9ACTN|nr:MULTISPECIES: hypothetical protein [Streptomyces]ARZ66121.1 hypothetical protein SMD11_0455 [Streptomyces albireticuli]UQI46377.1 hypothetical protein M1P56_19500 [Streptomyces sp. HU2014]
MGVTDSGRVDIEIGELVLTGFDHLDHDLVTEVFRRELHRLVQDRGVPVAGDTDLAVDLVRDLPPLPATASPHRLGTALARAVHTGLTRGGAGPDRAADRGRRT